MPVADEPICNGFFHARYVSPKSVDGLLRLAPASLIACRLLSLRATSEI